MVGCGWDTRRIVCRLWGLVGKAFRPVLSFVAQALNEMATWPIGDSESRDTFFRAPHLSGFVDETVPGLILIT